MCECNTYFNLENSIEFFFSASFCTALCFFVRVYMDHRTTESLILLNYAPENVLHPFLLPSLPQPCLLHSFSPSSSLGKPLSRQFLIGSRGTNPLHHPGRGRKLDILPAFYFWVPQVVGGWESSCRLFHKVTPVVVSFVCAPCR